MKQRRVFSNEFKLAAVNRTIGTEGKAGERVDDVARALHISPVLIYRWRQQLTAPQRNKKKEARKVELVAPTVTNKPEVTVLQEENKRLKKFVAMVLNV